MLHDCTVWVFQRKLLICRLILSSVAKQAPNYNRQDFGLYIKSTIASFRHQASCWLAAPVACSQDECAKSIPLNICNVPSGRLVCVTHPLLWPQKFVWEWVHAWRYSISQDTQLLWLPGMPYRPPGMLPPAVTPSSWKASSVAQRPVVLREHPRHFKGPTCHFPLSREASQ